MITEESKPPESGRWQFSLRTLMIFVLIVAACAAWYGHRLRRVAIERHRLDGKWQIEGPEGKVAMLNGQPLIVELKPGNYSVDPFQEPRSLDLHSQLGKSNGIYEWVGDRLHYMWIDSGMQRPTSFDQTDFQMEPGSNLTGFSQGTFYLKRMPDQ